jgi:pyruvate/2-oxoglutarate dehydrogenase complex dihydrolipoamide dehydrogenase (E3) component
MKENPLAKVVVVKNSKGLQTQSQFSPNDLSLSRIDFVTGEAEIISPYEISVNGKIFAARNLLIATGAAANIPEFEGVRSVKYFTLDSLWQLSEAPRRLLVIGENLAACNLAQTYSERGSKVTLVTSETRLLQDEDKTVGEYILSNLAQQDVTVVQHAFLQRFATTKDLSLAFFDHDGNDLVIEFDVVLFALGEVPNTGRIGLEKLEIPLNPDGTILVDSSLRTNYPTIFACGKVARYLD